MKKYEEFGGYITSEQNSFSSNCPSLVHAPHIEWGGGKSEATLISGKTLDLFDNSTVDNGIFTSFFMFQSV